MEYSTSHSIILPFSSLYPLCIIVQKVAKNLFCFSIDGMRIAS